MQRQIPLQRTNSNSSIAAAASSSSSAAAAMMTSTPTNNKRKAASEAAKAKQKKQSLDKIYNTSVHTNPVHGNSLDLSKKVPHDQVQEFMKKITENQKNLCKIKIKGTKLNELSLDEYQHFIETILKNSTALTEITFEDCGITTEMLKIFVNALMKPYQNLEAASAKDEKAAAPAPMSDKDEKSVLAMQNPEPFSNEHQRRAIYIPNSPRPFKLSLRKMNICNEGVRYLGNIFPLLCHLDLSSNQLDNESALAIAEQLTINTTIKSLVLNNNNITGAGAEALGTMLKTNRAIQSLALGYNKLALHKRKKRARNITAGLHSILTSLQNNPTVTALSLRTCDLAINAGKIINDQLPNLNYLLTLDLMGNKFSVNEASLACNNSIYSLGARSTTLSRKQKSTDDSTPKKQQTFSEPSLAHQMILARNATNRREPLSYLIYDFCHLHQNREHTAFIYKFLPIVLSYLHPRYTYQDDLRTFIDDSFSSTMISIDNARKFGFQPPLHKPNYFTPTNQLDTKPSKNEMMLASLTHRLLYSDPNFLPLTEAEYKKNLTFAYATFNFIDQQIEKLASHQINLTQLLNVLNEMVKLNIISSLNCSLLTPNEYPHSQTLRELTLLMLAVIHNQHSLLDMLMLDNLQHPINQSNSHGITALHIAAHLDKLPMFKYLCSKGAIYTKHPKLTAGKEVSDYLTSLEKQAQFEKMRQQFKASKSPQSLFSRPSKPAQMQKWFPMDLDEKPAGPSI